MNKEKNISQERKQYLKKKKTEKILIRVVQFSIVIGFIVLWEVLANKGIIDSFIMSQPSRMVKTFLNLASNNLLEHMKVTCLETLIGFLLGTFLGAIIAIMLWWSKFLSKVSEPFLVVLNSLPKVALRTSYNYLGRCRNASNNSNGTSNCDGGLMTTNTGKPANALNTAKKSIDVDAQALANLVSKMKENNKINENVKIKVDRIPNNVLKPEFKDFADQMIYFRKKLGYTQKQVGKAIGVSEDTYRRYELREIEVIDINKINKIMKVLKFTEKPKVSEYVQFLMSSPEKMLIKFLKESGISRSEFARKAGFHRKAIFQWVNKERTISEESYNKIKKFMKEYEEEKLYKEQIIEEEEEME